MKTKILMWIKNTSSKGWEYLCKIWEFLNLEKKELLFLGLMYLILLGINYVTIAMIGFAISYSKVWPSISCLEDIGFLMLPFFIGHFLCLRSPWYLWSLVTLHYILLFVLLAIYITTGTFFCESILYLIYDTNAAETKDFCKAYLSLKNVSLLILTLLIYFIPMHFLTKLCKRRKKYCKGDIVCSAILLILFLPLLVPAVKASISGGSIISDTTRRLSWHHPFYHIQATLENFHEQAGKFTYEMRHRQKPDFVKLHHAVTEDPPIGVIVIGESAIRDHHSIYGYYRNTTPNLMKYQEDIVAFDDTIAVLPMTITALKYWLTDMTLNNRHVKWTIFDALTNAGYKIDIFTNQNKSGWADSPVQMIFSTANTTTFMHEENFSDLPEDANAQIYDINLIPHFDSWLKKVSERKLKQPKLIVIHLFGSHDPYFSRYPKDFSDEFLKDTTQHAIINQYDTSILYTDMILGKILDKLNDLKQPSFMIYFSDHGSVCTPSHLRTPNSIENSAYEIPFLVWRNKKYQTMLPEMNKRMERSKHLPLQADQAHYGLLEIMGITFTKDIESQNFLSEKFKCPPRTVLEGKQPYKKKDTKQK